MSSVFQTVADLPTVSETAFTAIKDGHPLAADALIRFQRRLALGKCFPKFSRYVDFDNDGTESNELF